MQLHLTVRAYLSLAEIDQPWLNFELRCWLRTCGQALQEQVQTPVAIGECRRFPCRLHHIHAPGIAEKPLKDAGVQKHDSLVPQLQATPGELIKILAPGAR